MIRRPPRSTLDRSSAASDVYKRQVHRDVKPANVLMTSDGRVKVADFGLAYLIDREGGTTRTGFLVGSPNYMSPEQATGQKIDRRSDIYSLGVVLFRMLTGRVPFVAESSHAVLFMQVGQEPPDPRELNKSISLVTRGLVLKALNKKPEARFQTMAEFRDVLLRQSAALGAGVAGEISMDDGTVALNTADVRGAAARAGGWTAAARAAPREARGSGSAAGVPGSGGGGPARGHEAWALVGRRQMIKGDPQTPPLAAATETVPAPPANALHTGQIGRELAQVSAIGAHGIGRKIALLFQMQEILLSLIHISEPTRPY